MNGGGVPGSLELFAHAIANANRAGAFVFFMVLLLPQWANESTKSVSHSASSRRIFFVMRAVFPICNPHSIQHLDQTQVPYR